MFAGRKQPKATSLRPSEHLWEPPVQQIHLLRFRKTERQKLEDSRSSSHGFANPLHERRLLGAREQPLPHPPRARVDKLDLLSSRQSPPAKMTWRFGFTHPEALELPKDVCSDNDGFSWAPIAAAGSSTNLQSRALIRACFKNRFGLRSDTYL